MQRCGVRWLTSTRSSDAAAHRSVMRWWCWRDVLLLRGATGPLAEDAMMATA
ncbi:hypothetical protein MANES_06G004501v8 [Manihot esculenta]|uniref:Uncharacterized protein n=1 Tax=Manihot esculenta TaxID=3983 RepID=A0ACC8DEE2_MANES|nr:hypothetical protein MANES_06G004501v8 [Manihot esculenta]